MTRGNDPIGHCHDVGNRSVPIARACHSADVSIDQALGRDYRASHRCLWPGVKLYGRILLGCNCSFADICPTYRAGFAFV